MVWQYFDKVRPSSAQLAILPKMEFTLDLTEEFWFIHRKAPLLKTSIQQNAGLESILAILLKQTLPQGVYGMSSAR